MKKIERIAYSFLIGDLLHFGHIKMLESAKEKADYHICGVISDNVVKKWINPLICSYKERKAVVEKISYVDEVIIQNSMDPKSIWWKFNFNKRNLLNHGKDPFMDFICDRIIDGKDFIMDEKLVDLAKKIQ